MMRRRSRSRLPNGVGIKKRILVEGLALIRLLRAQPTSRIDAEIELGIPCREFYRYLEALRLAAAPLRRERIGPDRVIYRIAAGWP